MGIQFKRQTGATEKPASLAFGEPAISKTGTLYVGDSGGKAVDVGISTYTHAKSGTVHTLTGSGDNIRFVATAAFAEGDTFKVGATACTAKTVAGDALWAGFFVSGAVVVCYRTGNVLNFNAGGLPAAAKAQLTPANIKTGVHIQGGGIDVTGMFTADADATAGDVLNGKTAYVAGNKVEGEIPIQSTFTIEIPMFSTTPVILPKGYYGENVMMLPKYVTGTKFTDFSGTGYFGATKRLDWCNSGTMGVSAASATNGSVYFSLTNRPERDGAEASYGGQSTFCFLTPFAHEYDYCIIEASSTGSCNPVARFVSSIYDSIRWDFAPGLGSRTPYSKATPYLQLGCNIAGAPAWINISGTVTFKSITFYKNAT